MSKRIFVGDFETTTREDDCRVWASCIVDIDTNGRCYFDELDVEVAKNREAALDAMGVPKDFVPTKLY